jgi:OOP family OmpA-OmpF porin
MRLVSLAASAVFAVTAFATTAEAGGSSVAYFGLRGSFVETGDDNTTSASIDYSQSYNDGFAAAVFMGWVLDQNFRLELEAGYRNADLNTVHVTKDDFSDPADVPGSAAVGGSAQVGAMMTNLYYDIHFLPDIGVLPWIGAGIGGAYIDYSISEPTTYFLDAHHVTWAFACQVMAGITVPLADGISASIGYRFFQTPDFTFVDDFGPGSLNYKTRLTQQSVDVGLQFHI